ncbi:unnamed protein product [Brassica rapa]|uniref:Uncharacterized protein n=2 Tax=Brassica campestris TaxID=3711 RepID=A0A8D9H8Q0_BRACM|nr:unnamed protein product [Brassica rapa]
MRWDPIIKRYYSREANNNCSSALMQLFYKQLAQAEGYKSFQKPTSCFCVIKNIHFVIFETDCTELLKMIEYNTRLLERGSYFMKRHVLMDNFRIMMNLLREPIKKIQIERPFMSSSCLWPTRRNQRTLWRLMLIKKMKALELINQWL